MPAITFDATDAKGRVDWLVKALKVPMDELSVAIGYSGKNADRDVNEKFLAGKSRDLNDRYAKLVRYCDHKAKAKALGVQYTAATAPLAAAPSNSAPRGGGGNGDDGEAYQAGQSLQLPPTAAAAAETSATTYAPKMTTTTTTATAAATVAGYIYMNVLGTMEHHPRGNDGTVDAAAVEEVQLEGPDGPLVVLKVGKAESHRLGVRMRTEAHAAAKFGLMPGWGSEGTNGKRGGGRALRASVMTCEASFTPKYRDAVPYLAVDDIDNDEGLVRSMWIQHAGAVPLRDDAALRWLMSHPTVASPLPNLVEARRVAQTLGAMTELLVVPRYAFERVQQRARHDFGATRAKWTVQELANTLKGSRVEQHVARVFAETRRLLATRRHTTTDDLLHQRDDDADIVAACDAFAARVRALLTETKVTSSSSAAA